MAQDRFAVQHLGFHGSEAAPRWDAAGTDEHHTPGNAPGQPSIDIAARRVQRPAEIVAPLAQLEAQSVDVLGAVLSLDGHAADAEARDANLVDVDGLGREHV